jgi:hypothetical protein
MNMEFGRTNALQHGEALQGRVEAALGRFVKRLFM